MAFSNYIKNLRLEHEESQVSMAKNLDISVTALKYIEGGVTKLPSEKLLGKICEYTNSSPKEVMLHILFEESAIKKKYCVCKYLTQMYLEGWNVNLDHNNKNKTGVYDAKIIKKRENKNIVYVVHSKRYLKIFKSMTKDIENDHFDLISYITIKALMIEDSFRGLQILFDSNSKEEKEIYDSLGTNEYKHVDFYVDAILFDADKSEVLETKRVKK